ncbi:carbon-nitrogen hydrolase family protein [Algoriphagus litoralis]|uniref:carbon-nitrogen hydrolase family protein n=1 Tax=Algoriphagus litoralis TaxID=2202829 RepID=UPI000DBAAFB7|nr:carbon-nitrogen hydrolase family protein [Algoriphagus litoralis]
MKIALAQINSQKGNVEANELHHLQVIEQAARAQADLIIFPELSITGYEPDLAQSLAMELSNSSFDPFQEAADRLGISIGIGMPTPASEGVQISMLIFQPGQERSQYAKQLLHSDELPYFVCGRSQTLLSVKGKIIALGICYESMQREQVVPALLQADCYIASVAKDQKGLEKAYVFYAQIASEFRKPILMVNSLGFQDNFFAAGQSAVWDQKGYILAALDGEQEGLLLYDSEGPFVSFLLKELN